jgi:hypothetical protein
LATDTHGKTRVKAKTVDLLVPAEAEFVPPWHGYDLGHWPADLAEEAALATRSDYFKTGAKAAKRRRRDVGMNTPITEVKREPCGPRYEQDS